MLVEVLLQVLEDHVQRVVLSHHLLEAHDVRVVQLAQRLWREQGMGVTVHIAHWSELMNVCVSEGVRRVEWRSEAFKN